MTASFKTTRYHGKEVKRGQVITSQETIVSYTGLNRSVVRLCLRRLTEAGLLTIIPSVNREGKVVKRYGSMLQLNNYDTVTVEPGKAQNQPEITQPTTTAQEIVVPTPEVKTPAKKETTKQNDDKRFVAISNLVRDAKDADLVAIRNVDAMSHHLFNEYMKNRYSSFTLPIDEEAAAIHDAWLQTKAIFQEPSRKKGRNEIKADELLRYVRYEDEQYKKRIVSEKMHEAKECAAFIRDLDKDFLNINDDTDASVIAGYLKPFIQGVEEVKDLVKQARNLYKEHGKNVILSSVMLYFEKVMFTGQILLTYRNELSRLVTPERYMQLLNNIRSNYSHIIKAKTA